MVENSRSSLTNRSGGVMGQLGIAQPRPKRDRETAAPTNSGKKSTKDRQPVHNGQSFGHSLVTPATMRDSRKHFPVLLDQLTGGDVSVLAALFVQHRAQLRREIARDLSSDPRLDARFDASDVVQELFHDAQTQVVGYVANHARVDFLAWLRGLARERCIKFRRDHLNAQCRTMRRQQPLPEESWRHPPTDDLSPSDAARTDERDDRVRQALLLLKPEDQEVIRLRLFEGLTNPEAASRLGLSVAAATKRMARAMRRLREVLARRAETGGDLLQ